MLQKVNKEVVLKQLSYTSNDPNLIGIEINIDYSNKKGIHLIEIKGIDRFQSSPDKNFLNNLQFFIQESIDDINADMDYEEI